MAIEEPEKEEIEPPPYDESIVNTFAYYLKIAHSRSENFQLTDIEAQGLSDRICNVLKYYIKINLKAGGRAGAFISLMMTSGLIYGPKAMAKAAKTKAEAESAAQQAANNVDVVMQ